MDNNLPTVSYTNSGITVNHKNRRIYLDPNKVVKDCDFIFVSHAHTDHLHKRSNLCRGKIITSNATLRIAKLRGYNLCCDGYQQEYHGFNLLDAGHILGSKGLLIDDDLYYTGDISIRERAFMKPAIIPKVKTLIIESTFGHEDYTFPRIESIVHETNTLISKTYNNGRPLVLLGYPLGKAQILTKLFDNWEPIIVDDYIYKMNQSYLELGVGIPDHLPHSVAQKRGLLSPNKPWILIAPLNSARNGILRLIKKKYDALTIGFSGWAVKPSYKYHLGLDHCFPLSDHCDHNELISVVKRCCPERVYTFHGFAYEFAKTLQSLGFDATSLELSRTKVTESPSLASQPASQTIENYFDKSFNAQK